MKWILILLFPVIAIVSCKDKNEEVCMPPSVTRHLPGEWNAAGTLMGSPVGPVRLVFEESGDLTGSDEIFQDMFGETRNVTWRAERQQVFLSLEYGSGGAIEFVLPILANECNKIIIGEEEVLYIELSRSRNP